MRASLSGGSDMSGRPSWPKGAGKYPPVARNMRSAMLKRITIGSFKSLPKLELDLGQINVFIGANGSGKSNLLEAIGILGAAAFGRVEDETLLRRGVRPGVPRLYKSAFPTTKRDVQPHIMFGAESDAASYSVTLWNPNKNPNPAWKFKTEKLLRGTTEVASRSTTSEKKSLNQEHGLAALKAVGLPPGDAALSLMHSLRSYCIYNPNTPTLRGLSPDLQSREPVGLSGGRLPEAVSELRAYVRNGRYGPLEVLEEVSELIDWARSWSSVPSSSLLLSASAARSPHVVQFVDRYMTKGRNTLTGYDASEGALYVLFAAVLALHPRTPPCIAIDNVDQALNPLLAMRLTGAICHWTFEGDTNRQWLLTAHNPAVLDGLPLDDEKVRLFAVDRDNKGHTSVKRVVIDDRLKREHEKSGWPLSRMWMNGLIGGVPNV